jgi:hypothetical protein
MLTDTTFSAFYTTWTLKPPEEVEEKNVPQKIHLRDSWSRTFCNVGGSVSVAIVYGDRISSSTVLDLQA